MEDGDRIEHLTGDGVNYAGCMAPKEDAAMKYKRETITDATDKGTMYLWYKSMQENTICYGVPVMPVRGIVLKQEAYRFWTRGRRLNCMRRAGSSSGRS